MTAGAVSAPLIIPITHRHRAKNHIDTSTPVSIQSDTPGVLIFYSLDGSRPAAAQRSPAGSSRKYSEPVLLPAGRVSVRAVAVTSDGRESSMVTKVFSVELVDSNLKENVDDLQSSAQRPSEGTLRSTENPAGSSLRPPEPRMMGNTSPNPGPRFLNGRLGSPNPAAQTERSLSASSGALKQLSSTQMTRFIRETNLLRCVQCLSVRPSDPLARFCAQCGAAAGPLAAHRRPPADGGQPVCVEDSAPSVPSADSRMLSCSRCKRMNRRDARFCDWCGSKPDHAARCVICCRCGASGDPYAFFCTTCGIFLEAPAPPTCYGDIRRPVGDATAKRAAATPAHDITWQAMPSSGPAPMVRMTTPTAEQCTQTVGLYYPSSTELQRKEKQRAQELSRQQAPRDGRQLLTTVSPGRGYWRRQLDHVCGHLRSYTQNNVSFRALLGEPRLGRMVSAVIHEDRYEVSVTVSFVSAGREENQVDPAADGVGLTAGRTETLSSITERSSDSSRLRSDASTGVMKSPKPNLTPKPPVKDLQLLKELGPGRGQISTIQQLLDQGAAPSCRDSDGQHALAVAVVNGHHDVLPVLVQRGADVDEQSGQMKNSALHEAAARGSEGLQCAEVLLSCKASVRCRNASGQTAYDVAVRSGCNNMVSLLAAQTGLDLLGKLGKPRLNLDVF
ncbi:double zinc ribbon and ankyrin repeat-containing protein 1 isoform X4 [Acanthopagrus latus]|uniref:double zinc ribbon and ankyrin repeat-containing protein 1 isoform X4 n=1 Tax=Acanthopagrus latus TaxID=8177 RepID=UPI00187CC3B6|nr:double zinc ribbon and ankyrin repeat-containing protein 1 isoform X4 [Acanthopagrus latus]